MAGNRKFPGCVDRWHKRARCYHLIFIANSKREATPLLTHPVLKVRSLSLVDLALDAGSVTAAQYWECFSAHYQRCAATFYWLGRSFGGANVLVPKRGGAKVGSTIGPGR